MQIKTQKKEVKGVVFENCALFTYRLSKISNSQIYNAKYLDADIYKTGSFGNIAEMILVRQIMLL